MLFSSCNDEKLDLFSIFLLSISHFDIAAGQCGWLNAFYMKETLYLARMWFWEGESAYFIRICDLGNAFHSSCMHIIASSFVYSAFHNH